MRCPCSSKKEYDDCCAPFHQGKKLPETPLELMRSRYSAYALSLPFYIIETTHPENPHRNLDVECWAREILLFCSGTEFRNLEIISAKENLVIPRPLRLCEKFPACQVN